MGDRKITVTEASQNFEDLVNRTYYRGESTVLIRFGEPMARVSPVGGCSILGADLAERWTNTMIQLSSDEAESFSEDVEASRKNLEMPEGKMASVRI